MVGTIWQVGCDKLSTAGSPSASVAERGIRVNAVLGWAQRAEDFAPACVFFGSAADSGQISGETLALGWGEAAGVQA